MSYDDGTHLSLGVPLIKAIKVSKKRGKKAIGRFAIEHHKPSFFVLPPFQLCQPMYLDQRRSNTLVEECDEMQRSISNVS
eukprot:1159954-Pelagomonas_calceolata.AAC.3